MDVKHLLIIGVLASLVVTFSGCTLPGQGGEKETPVVTQVPNEGIIIEYFGPSESYIIGGQDVEVKVRVRNVGQANGTVEDIKWPESLYGIFESYSEPTDCEGEELSPPNPDKKQEGESCEASTGSLTTKSVQAQKTYSGEGFKVSVKYTYTTKAQVHIPVYSTAIVNKKRRDGTLPSYSPPTENTYAPIKLYYEGDAYLEAPSSGSKEYTESIRIQNAGSGRLDVDEWGRQKVDKIEVTTPIGGTKEIQAKCEDVADNRSGVWKVNESEVNLVCKPYGDGGEVEDDVSKICRTGDEEVNVTCYTGKGWATITDIDCKKGPTLSKGYCKFKIKINNADNNIPAETTLPLTIKATYTYIVEKSSSITIRP